MKSKVVIQIPCLNEEAAMQTKDTVDYYTKRAAVQNYENSFHLQFLFGNKKIEAQSTSQ